MTDTFSRDPRPHIQYTGDGARTVFAFPYPVLASDDLLAYLGGLTATGVAITGLGDPAGVEVTFDEAPGAGVTVTLMRRTEAIRETEFVDGGPFRASAINAELDRIMLLIQEDRDEQARALRGQPFDGALDTCLPPTTARAGKLLGFDSAGAPQVFGQGEVPASGDASGAMVTASGATTARSLGEHVATLVDVRDFGAIGDGVTDDTAAFQAAIAAAESRHTPVYVPAGATAYVIGTGLTLDGVTMLGEGAGSLLKLGLGGGFGLKLDGSGARLCGLRLLGPGANAWPVDATQVDLTGIAGDGVQIAAAAEDAALAQIEVAGCQSAIGVDGQVRAIVDVGARFSLTGIELRAGASGPIYTTRIDLHGCTDGIRLDAAATIDLLSVRGGHVRACGKGLDLESHASAWRSVEVADVAFADNVGADLVAGARLSLALRGCRLDDSGKRRGAGVVLEADGETVEAPSLIAETTRANVTEVVSVPLSGGTNLNLLAPGDLMVLAADANDVNDHWTSLKASRGGVVHAVTAQTTTTATVDLATASGLPPVTASDVVRIVGRSGSATVDSVGAAATASSFIWIQAEDHCRVFAAHDPMPVEQIQLGGSDAVLHHLPGLGGAPSTIAGVELEQAAVNGAFMRLHTFELAQDSAASFTPDSAIGMVMAFGHGALGDPITATFSYRADGLGYVELLSVGTAPTSSEVEVEQLMSLTGTTGTAGKFTYSTHTDGKIYVENRLIGSPRKVSLMVFGVPL